MRNKLKVSEMPKKYDPTNFEEQQKLADQYLSKITMLQEQLSIEEQKLMQLLRSCGTEIVTNLSTV